MSDWGRVALYYDYEMEVCREGTQPVKGLISKAYKYPGVNGMLLHAFYGIRYFWNRCDNEYFDFNGSEFSDLMGAWEELNTAFDVFFHFDVISRGTDDFTKVMSGEELSDEKLVNHLFNCEGMYGWLYMKYTGNATDGYILKYGYYYGDGGEYKVMSLRSAMELDMKRNKGCWMDEEELHPLFEAVLEFFETNAVLMDEDEFWQMEELGIEYVKELKGQSA